ncbi:MAG: AI-2E family transporter [Bacteroidota bacterium]
MLDQNTNDKEYPIYIKAPVTLLGLVLIFYIFHVLAGVLVPIAFSILIAILLNPLFSRLDRRMNRIVALLLTLLIATIFFIGLIYFLSTRVASFGQDLPLIKQKILLLLSQLEVWFESQLGFSMSRQIDAVKKSLDGEGSSTILTNTLGTVIGVLGVLFLLPIYVFLLLFYKPLILDFLFQVFSEKHSLRVAEILSQTKSAIQSFMVGLMIETAIVCTLNSIALIIIGVPNAIVIGIIGGILNILPYVGGLIAICLAVLMSLVTSNDFSPAFAIIGAYALIQFVDNNILVPRIVSSKVKINALISIVIVLLGGLLWGLSGMFLSIPFIAVLKIIFDRIDELKPWGRLLGDEVPAEHIGVAWQKRWDRIFRRLEKDKAIAAAETAAAENEKVEADPNQNSQASTT